MLLSLGLWTVERCLGSDDREVHLAEHVSVQLQLDLVVAGLLDQALGHNNDALIQLRATRLADAVDNLS